MAITSVSCMSASGDVEQVEAAEERAEHRGVGAQRREQALAEDRAHELALHLAPDLVVVGLGRLAAGLEQQAVRLGALGAVLHDRRRVPGLDLARRRRLEGEVERVVEGRRARPTASARSSAWTMPRLQPRP